jgi:hypothetical protein
MRRLVSALLAVVLLAGASFVSPVIAAPVPGAITWVVDHHAKTITVTVQIEIFSGCGGDPQGTAEGKAAACVEDGARVTQLQADKIKQRIEEVWNKNLKYKCYRLIFNVDVKVGQDRKNADKDRVPVVIDPSPAGVRAFVDADAHQKNWDSDLPEHRVEPFDNGTSIWSQGATDTRVRVTVKGKTGWVTSYEAAHEFGHVIGLSDGYHDEGTKDNPISVINEGAPNDIMSNAGTTRVDQSTLDRLVKRNRNDLKDTKGQKVSLDDLRCDYRLNVRIHMEGTNPAFLSEVLVEGKLILKELAQPKTGPGGQVFTHEAYGPLGYAVAPSSNRPCTFSHQGSGTMNMGAFLSLKYPIEPSTIELFLRPDVQGLPLDTTIARGCEGKVVKVKKIALLPLWFVNRLGYNVLWGVYDWHKTTDPKPAVADGYWQGACGAQGICQENDVFELIEIIP